MDKLKIGKLAPIAIIGAAVFYLIMAFVLPGGSEAWSRLLAFAPYIFGSTAILEMLVGANKYREKKNKDQP